MNHHLGLNWHPLEGAGIYTQICHVWNHVPKSSQEAGQDEEAGQPSAAGSAAAAPTGSITSY